MSKRKADFGTPEKDNKRPKTFGTPTASRSYRDEWKNGNPWLRYDAKSKAMFCGTSSLIGSMFKIFWRKWPKVWLKFGS